MSGVLWPEQLLPLDFKQARIITFGYDADIVRLFDKSSSNTVRDHGKSLAMDIAQRRVQTKSVGMLLWSLFANTDLSISRIAGP